MIIGRPPGGYTWPEFIVQSVAIAGLIPISNRFGFVYALEAAPFVGGLMGLTFSRVRQRRSGDVTDERRIWAIVIMAAVVAVAANILSSHVPPSSALSTACTVLVIMAIIVEMVALFAWGKGRERPRSAPGS
jgi:hypothetical protein